MAPPSSFDHGAEDWDYFKQWLKAEHLKGNNRLGFGVDDTGFVAFNTKHTCKEVPENVAYYSREAVRFLQDKDDDPTCFTVLKDECGSDLIQMQISWSRHIFLPIEEEDYCLCEECKKLIPNDDIKRYRLESGIMNVLPRTCDDCAEKP